MEQESTNILLARSDLPLAEAKKGNCPYLSQHII
jgi:hypothetical protein